MKRITSERGENFGGCRREKKNLQVENKGSRERIPIGPWEEKACKFLPYRQS